MTPSSDAASTATGHPGEGQPSQVAPSVTAPGQAESLDMLVARGVSVKFGGLQALLDIDLTVRPSQVVAIVGPNGAGKSTLLNALSGIVKMTGSVLLNGETVSGLAPRRLAQRGVSRSFQHSQLIEAETVMENVLCGGHLNAGYSAFDQFFRHFKAASAERRIRVRAAELLELAEIPPGHWSRGVSLLPHGARKRLDIVRALMARPTLMLMDEPTSGMGEAERGIVQSIVRRIRDVEQTTVIMVEHHMDVVRAVADHVVALNAGTLLLSGPTDAVLASDELIVASVGSALAEIIESDVSAPEDDESPPSSTPIQDRKG